MRASTAVLRGLGANLGSPEGAGEDPARPELVRADPPLPAVPLGADEEGGLRGPALEQPHLPPAVVVQRTYI